MRLCPLILITLLYACSDSVTGATLPDTLGVTPLEDATGSSDTGPDAASFPDLGTSDATPGPGVTPSYCNENADCPSGYCVEHLCASTCVDTCPEGAVCKAIAQAGADVAFVCVPQFPKLCRPCLSDSDCVGMVAVGDDRCIEFGPEGSFCGGDCSTAACPNGYACEDAPGGRRQCVPQDGQCSCRPEWIAEGAKTQCTKSNETGTCSAIRQCEPNGLSECNAAAATEEVCDGQDNDCDGIVDDGIAGTECSVENNFGTCTGTRTCQDGAFVCSAAVPALDVCDGLDNDCDGAVDQDFPDSDADGIADCLEADADADGIPNAEDNCETTPNPLQENYDSDSEGDACDTDDDNDLSPDAGDCAPLDEAVHPGATEACNGKDDDCDGETDEGFPDADEDQIADCMEDDADGDGIVNAADVCPLIADPDQANFDGDAAGDACDPDDDGDLWADKDDCAPYDPSVHPQADEVCNGKDDSCDGFIDEGFPDSDKDGVADCKDDDGDGDGIANGDDNCPVVPNGDQTDTDGDTLGDACDLDDDGDLSADTADCAPLDPARHPGATELCDGADQNCNGFIDEGFSDLDGDKVADCVDTDDDGDGALDGEDNCPVTNNPSQADFNQDGTGDACQDDIDADTDPNATDCAPYDPAVHHGAAEACNGQDDNCNGVVDEGFPDTDQDGVSNCIDDDDDGDVKRDDDDNCPLIANPGQADFDQDGTGDVCDDDDDGDGTADVADCAPFDASVYVGAPELCNGKDDSCNGQVDEAGASGCEDYFYNGDSDGFGQELLKQCLCGPTSPYTTKVAGDCDDKNAQVFPGATEACNGKDDDCNGVADEAGSLGCASVYADGDKDGYGAGVSACLCGAPAGYTAIGGDCNDADPTVKPAALELCNGKDDDCDELQDEEGSFGCAQWYFDQDEDGFGASAKWKCQCVAQGLYSAAEPGDCDDLDGAKYPGNSETCNTKDDNCNGQVDEGVLKTFFKDEDSDGYGGITPVSACVVPEGYSAQSGDCSDFNGDIYPGATEVCNDIDDDCDGKLDDGLPQVDLYTDLDGDGYGAKQSIAKKKCLYEGGQAPLGYSTDKTDCNDSNATVYVKAPELCDGILNNCSGSVADVTCPVKCAGSWPVNVGGSAGYPVVAQLDNDNELEVVAYNEGQVRAFEHDGSIKWSVAMQVSYSYPVVADLNHDSTVDVVVGAHSGTLYILNGQTGATLSSINTGTNYGYYGSVVFDVDGDGIFDIIPTGGAPYKLVLLNANLTVKQMVSLNTLGEPFFLATPALVDLNHDGTPEIAIGSGAWSCQSSAASCMGRLYVYDKTGAYWNDPTWTNPALPWFQVTSFPTSTASEGTWPVYADLDGDGVEELSLYFSNYAGGSKSFVWSVDGQEHVQSGVAWNATFPVTAPVAADGTLSPTGALESVGGPVADVDGDGIYEVIGNVAGGVGLRKAGAILDGYPIKLSAGPTVIADLDRDSRMDILFHSSSNNSVNCYTLGEGSYDEQKILNYGTVDGIGRAHNVTGSRDPFEPNDRGVFNAPASVQPLVDSRAFRISGLRDVFQSGGGWTHRLHALVGHAGDRDYYSLSGGIIAVTLSGGGRDYDLYVHQFRPDGTYIDTLSSTKVGTAAEAITCHPTNSCQLTSAVKTFIIEVRGKDPAADFSPVPYTLSTSWAY
ncbi:MAG: thrombospondin type 3 repeat-containing protein [Myxococcales bacterium]|nr:thrombospondin type 3 repeat-containing protein [Myxococcales bacterium]